MGNVSLKVLVSLEVVVTNLGVEHKVVRSRDWLTILVVKVLASHTMEMLPSIASHAVHVLS